MAVTTVDSMTLVVMTTVIAEMTPVVKVLVTRAGHDGDDNRTGSDGSCKGGVGRW